MADEVLFGDLCGVILKKMMLPDYIRAGSVCRHWNSVIKRNNTPTPYLMLGFCPTATSTTARLYSIFDHRVHNIPFPPPAISRRICIGSSFGWLITVDKTLDIHLVNPVTGVQVQLPSITTLPELSYYQNHVMVDFDTFKTGVEPYRDTYTPYEFFKKAVLSSSPSVDGSGDFTVVLVCHCRPYSLLLTVKPGDSAWTAVANIIGPFSDVITYKGSIYTVTNWGEVERWGFNDPSKPHRLVWEFDPDYLSVPYLAESVEGELLIVVRKRNPLTLGTTGFDVMVWKEKADVWKPVADTKDNVIFVGNGLSLSLSAQEFPKLRRNHVYFTDSIYYPSMFDMAEKRKKPIGSVQEHSEWLHPFWVTLKLS